MNVFSVSQGTSPIVLGQPHGGTWVPDDVWGRLNTRGQGLADTDWHIHQLYDGLLAEATVVQSHVHRYVIDANRDPAGVSLYPGQNTTGLVPLTDFDGEDIWLEGQEPSADEIEARRVAYHAPYHTALAEELARVKAIHGVALLFDCHSIRSNIPFLFEGTLPDFNIGTDGGKTCAHSIEAMTERVCTSDRDFTSVTNGRFRGGWTTRHYGKPDMDVHAIQMELAQSTYMTESAPWTYDTEKADRLRGYLGQILETLAHNVPALKGTS